jgi:RNA polymerase sigma-70 factor, ECF subfamily
MEIIDDANLIKNYLKGDEKSLEILIQRYLKNIYNFVYKKVQSEHDAQDITQETFLKVWKNIKKFDKNKSFKSWIFTIAKNTIIDFSRKRKTIPLSEFENENGKNVIIEKLADQKLLPDEIFYKKNLAKLFSEEINKLSEKYKIVLFMYYKDGFNFREIAEILKEPVNTIKSRHRRGLEIIKPKLEAHTY